MKTKYSLPLAIAALTLGANAQDTYQHPLTVALTASRTVQSSVVSNIKGVATTTDTTSSVSEKISNKEILAQLVKQNVIPVITGWSLVVISDTTGQPTGAYQLQKRGETPISVAANFGIVSNGFAIETGKSVIKVDGLDTTSSSSPTTSDKADFSLNLGNIRVDTGGLYVVKAKQTRDDKKGIADQTIISSASLTGLVGSALDLAPQVALDDAIIASDLAIANDAAAENRRLDAVAAKAAADLAVTNLAPVRSSRLEAAAAAAAKEVTAATAAKAATLRAVTKTAAAVNNAVALIGTSNVLVQGSAQIGAGTKVVAP